MGIILGIVVGVIVLGIIGMAVWGTLNESGSPQIAVSQTTNEFEVGEEVVINGMSYTVIVARVWNTFTGLNLYTNDDSQLVVINIKVKNVSNDPRSELRGFSLMDSMDRRYTGYYSALAFGDNIGRIQPGLEAKSKRVSVFEIPFDLQLEYYLILDDDNVVNLGRGNTFDIHDEVKHELGLS